MLTVECCVHKYVFSFAGRSKLECYCLVVKYVVYLTDSQRCGTVLAVSI